MTSQGCERFEEIGALHAVGAATAEEAQTLQAHLKEGCAACAAAQRDFQEIAARLAESLSPVAPPPAVRTRLLDALTQETGLAPGRSAARPSPAAAPRFRWSWAAGWALAAALGLVLVGNLRQQQQAHTRYNAELQALRQALGEKEKTLQLVEARNTHTVWLKGFPQAPDTLGKVFWNPDANTGFLVAFNLPAPPSGKVYQLWALQEGSKPVDAGTFAPNAQGAAAMTVKSVPNPKQPVQAFAITAEPQGGSAQPTSDILLKGIPITF